MLRGEEVSRWSSTETSISLPKCCSQPSTSMRKNMNRLQKTKNKNFLTVVLELVATLPWFSSLAYCLAPHLFMVHSRKASTLGLTLMMRLRVLQPKSPCYNTGGGAKSERFVTSSRAGETTCRTPCWGRRDQAATRHDSAPCRQSQTPA